MDGSDMDENRVWSLIGESSAKRAPAGFVGNVMRKIRVSNQEGELPGWLAWALAFGAAGAFAAIFICSGLIDNGVAANRDFPDYGLYEVEEVLLIASESAWAPQGASR